MIHTAEQLYALLPAIYRIRDAEQGEPLKALVAVLAREAGIVEQDITRLFENWFIETCEEWVLPYIGDLIGVRGLNPLPGAPVSERARVADTIGYRRRKGTAAMLEQLSRDTTAWPAHVVEFFQLLGTTQNLNHLRLFNARTPDLRRGAVLELLDTPFDGISHTADVRHIASRRGRHNIPDIGIFLWRLQEYPVRAGVARAADGAPAGCFRFHPLGIDAPLFNIPQPELDETKLTEEPNVPAPLRRRALFDELEALRQSEADGSPHTASWFGAKPVLQLRHAAAAPIPSAQIVICDLSAWKIPPASLNYRTSDATGAAVTVPLPIRAAVDPLLGRIAFNGPASAADVRVDYSYGFPGDLGGGPYDREQSLRALRALDGNSAFLERVTWQAGVSHSAPVLPGPVFPTIAEAVAEWNALAAPKTGIIAIMDSRSYAENLTGTESIVVPDGCQLLVVAADWPLVPDGSGGMTRRIGQLIASGLRPHLRGDVHLRGIASAGSTVGGEAIFSGLLIEGNCVVRAGSLGSLRVQHGTLAPLAGTGTLTAEAGNPALTVAFEKSIVAGITLADGVRGLTVTDSIVDRSPGMSVSAGTVSAELTRSTFFGSVTVDVAEASECLFVAPLRVARLQQGCVRFSFVPAGSKAPRRFRCQPETALAGVTDAAAQAELRARIVPVFTASVYGDPAYAQLADTAPLELREGAEDGSEMGGWSFLKQAPRERNLRASLDEYLRFGLEAGIFFVT